MSRFQIIVTFIYLIQGHLWLICWHIIYLQFVMRILMLCNLLIKVPVTFGIDGFALELTVFFLLFYGKTQRCILCITVHLKNSTIELLGMRVCSP